jgi:hypothetical protein
MVQLANRHVLIVGGPGYGKTTAEVKDLVEEADRGDTAIVCIDPHTDSLAATFFAHLCERGHRHRVLYDRLGDITCGIKWDFLTPSKATSPRQRRAENQTSCEQFAEILLRRRGSSSSAKTPGIEEWLLPPLNMYIEQRKRRPLGDVRHAFEFEHPKFQDMLANCQHLETRDKYAEIIDSRQTHYKAAERVILGVFRSPAFQARSEHVGSFRFERHLDDKGIVIVEGGEGRLLSADAMRTMMGAVILKTFNYLRERKREFPRVTLALDEVNNASLVSEAGSETRALAELRKMGLGVHVLAQLLDFPSPRVERAVMATCATRKYFNCSDPRTLARLGDDLGGSYKSEGLQRRYYKDGSIFDAPKTVENSYAKALRNLPVGECITCRGSAVSHEKIDALSPPFGLSKAALAALTSALLRVVQQRPEYFGPRDQRDPPPAGQSPPTPATQPDGSDGPFGI